jgi:hypothetical protein
MGYGKRAFIYGKGEMKDGLYGKRFVGVMGEIVMGEQPFLQPLQLFNKAFVPAAAAHGN